MDCDCIAEISVNEWSKLKELYTKDWPQWVHVHMFITISYHLQMMNINYNIKFYGLNNSDWKSDGTFVAISQVLEMDHRVVIQCFTTGSVDRLHNLLYELKRYNWYSQELSWELIGTKELKPCMDGIRAHSLNILYFQMGFYMWLSKTNASQFDISIPFGLCLKPLNVNHASEIYKHWPAKDFKNISYIKMLLHLNCGIGLFATHNNTLISWILRNECGALSVLHTKEEHRRKGYGQLITKIMCKQNAENDMDSIVYIIVGNSKSIRLFEKLNFRLIDYVAWIATKPTAIEV